MDWLKGNFTGRPHIEWDNRWFPVDFSLNRSINMDKETCLKPPTRL